MIMTFSNKFFLVLLFFLSLTLHMVGIWHPQEAVFDEVHFGKFVSGYLTGQYFFDIHPPLGKLMIAGIGKLSGFKTGFDFLTIGEQYPNNQYIWLRMLPAFFGSLLAPLIYLLTLRLSRSRWSALFAGLFVAFENALLVQSKFILIDSFLLFFGFAALYFFLESRVFFKEGKWGLWSCALASICAGLAFSVKWTAVSFLGLILLFSFLILIKEMVRMWRHKEKSRNVRGMLIGCAFFLVIPILIYLAFFAVHFRLLMQPGTGNAYMGMRFNQSQKLGFPPRDFLANLYDVNAEMFRANQRITATHSYGSKWYTWPFMLRPVYYWNKDITAGGNSWYERIYLIGNPFVWWLSAIAVIYFLVSGITKGIIAVVRRLTKKRARVLSEKSREKSEHIFAVWFLGLAYVVNFFPFIFIGRVMFLYHYLTALVIAIMMMAITFGTKPRKRMFVFLIAGTLTGFYIMFPITYGAIINTPWPRSIFWLKSWI